MSVTVPTKDVGEVKDVYRKECGYVKGLEDRNEEYIKGVLGVRD